MSFRALRLRLFENFRHRYWIRLCERAHMKIQDISNCTVMTYRPIDYSISLRLFIKVDHSQIKDLFYLDSFRESSFSSNYAYIKVLL